MGNHCQLSSTAFFFFLNLKIPKLMVYREKISSHAIGWWWWSCMLLFRKGELIVCLVFVFETGSQSPVTSCTSDPLVSTS